ncbi:MAG: hypothetical protein PVF45_12950 [Anaerolineae bacterium]|jgi:hypothetical protein
MTATRGDRQTAGWIAATTARGQRQRRGQAGAARWDITETTPGTFRVVTGNGDYALWYYPESARWACSCPDHSESFGVAHKLGIACKHIFGVQARADLVDPNTEIPLSLLGPGEGGDDTLPQDSHSHDYDYEETNIMTNDTPTSGKYLITRVKKGQTTTGKTVIELYSKRLKHPVLRLFELAELKTVGIDHHELDERERHVKFWAYYQESGKTNSEGNPYLDVLYLEPIGGAPAPAAGSPAGDAPALLQALQALTGEVRAIKALLAQLAQPAAGVQAQAQPAPAPQPAPPADGKASAEQRGAIRRLLAELGHERHDEALVQAGFVKLADLTAEQAVQAIERLESAKSRAEKARAAAAADNGR